MTTWRGLFWTAIGGTLAAACGGATALDSGGFDDGGAGGSTSRGGGFTTTGGRMGNGTGGRVSAGGRASTGGYSTGGHYFGTGGVQGCCGAVPTCDYGDVLQLGPCPPGVVCYERSLCCSTITCARAACTAVPECNPGDKQIQGPCPPSYSCYSVGTCGATITCLSPYPAVDAGPPPIVDGGACYRDTEYWRSYVGLSLQQCNQIKYTCPSGATPFYGECGCGCEQDRSCPEWVDCMPGSSQSPYCTEAGRLKCPYTRRAF